MAEFKIDPEKYRGMSAAEAEAAMVEDEREFVNSHPAVVAARERIEEREREEKAEEKRKADEARRQREADAEERWQEEYERRQRIWTASGGAESDFDAAWPEIRHKLLMERVSGRYSSSTR
jgi:hypothetical protein